MKYVFYTFLLIIAFSCSNSQEMVGKTKKGDLMSPCVGTNNSPCSDRFNPNANNPKLLKYIS
ncbi:MAG: hypothetical protein ACI9CD_001244 [Candidatus Deianiraeaceae bacterium]|jgi:hypothetical protein